MKKIFSLILLAAIFQFSVNAQISKGSFYIDGNINYNNDNIKNDANANVNKTTKFIFSPNFGYFITKNFAIGVGLDYQNLIDINSYNISSSIDNQVTITSTSKQSEFSPVFFAKYVIPISDKLSFSLNARYSHGFMTNEINLNGNIHTSTSDTLLVSPTIKPSSQTNRISISPEFQYLITSKIGLKINFTGFSFNSIPTINLNPTTDYDVNGKISIINGISYRTQNTTSLNINPTAWSVGVFILLGGQGL